MYSSDFSTFVIDTLYTIIQRSKQFLWNLQNLVGLIENSWTFQKHFWSTWNFILLLTEDDSALKSCSTNSIPNDSCLLTVCLEKIKVCIDNCGIFRKIIFDLEPARLILKFDVPQLKDKLF